MDIPAALYNSPSTAFTGIFAALCLIVLASFGLWQSAMAGPQQKLKTVLSAILLGITGFTMLATTAHLALVQIDFEEKTVNDPYLNLPKTSAVAVWTHMAVVLVLIGIVTMALLKRDLIATAGSVLLLSVSLMTFADLMHSRMLQHSWALGVTFGWFLAVVTALAFVVTAATVKIHRYGQRQFERGQAAALDAAMRDTLQTANKA